MPRATASVDTGKPFVGISRPDRWWPWHGLALARYKFSATPHRPRQHQISKTRSGYHLQCVQPAGLQRGRRHGRPIVKDKIEEYATWSGLFLGGSWLKNRGPASSQVRQSVSVSSRRNNRNLSTSNQKFKNLPSTLLAGRSACLLGARHQP